MSYQDIVSEVTQVRTERPMDRAEQGLRIGFALGVLTMLQHRVSADATKDQSIGIQKAIDGLREMWDAPYYVPPTPPTKKPNDYDIYR